MDIIAKLKEERAKLERERTKACAKYDRAIAEIDAATSTIMKARKAAPTSDEGSYDVIPRANISIDDAILEAVATGLQTPAKILNFLASDLGIETTINSVRTRVSRLGAAGKLTRDQRGWVVADEAQVATIASNSSVDSLKQKGRVEETTEKGAS